MYLIGQYSEINFVLKSRSEDFDESLNKPNTIFLARQYYDYARHSHWVCFSNINLEMNKTKNFEKSLFVMYDCLNKAASSDISSRDEWLLGYSYYISRLFPDLDKIPFYTVNTFLPIKKTMMTAY